MSKPATPQVHAVILRDQDKYNETPRLVHLIPIGEVLGIAVTDHGQTPEDKDIVFVSMKALEIALPALGFTGRAGLGAVLDAPRNAER